MSSQTDEYSSMVGAVYIFNLIVGTGALTMPSAFSHAGWLVGVILTAILAFLSYVTATFVVESMTSTNAILRWESLHKSVEGTKDKTDDSTEGHDGCYSDECDRLLERADKSTTDSTSFYGFEKCVEMGQMAGMYFNKAGLICFYVTISIYLYGDLAIYAAAVSKTLRDITCVTVGNASVHAGGTDFMDDAKCWTSFPVTRSNAYHIYVAAFAILLGPFTFYNVQKTKWLQMTTSILRWTAFLLMVTLASIHLLSSTSRFQPQVLNVAGVPSLFGVTVYSFMCHHSLPSIITPVAPKNSIYSMMALNYACVLLFYLLLALTGIFSFQDVRDLYTLNFAPTYASDHDLPTNSVAIQYFLSLFPVFTLGTNFPIIAITLRNNLRQLAVSLGHACSADSCVAKFFFPLLTIIPPLLVALATENLQILVGVTGSFAGVGVQYIIPTSLLLLSRKTCSDRIGSTVANEYASPFHHNMWSVFIITWSVLCIALIVTNYGLHGL